MIGGLSQLLRTEVIGWCKPLTAFPVTAATIAVLIVVGFIPRAAVALPLYANGAAVRDLPHRISGANAVRPPL